MIRFNKFIKNSISGVLMSSVLLNNVGYCSKYEKNQDKNKSSFAEKSLVTTFGLVTTGGIVALGCEVFGNSSSAQHEIDYTPKVLSQDLITNFQQQKGDFVKLLKDKAHMNNQLNQWSGWKHSLGLVWSLGLYLNNCKELFSINPATTTAEFENQKEIEKCFFGAVINAFIDNKLIGSNIKNYVENELIYLWNLFETDGSTEEKFDVMVNIISAGCTELFKHKIDISKIPVGQSIEQFMCNVTNEILSADNKNNVNRLLPGSSCFKNTYFKQKDYDIWKEKNCTFDDIDVQNVYIEFINYAKKTNDSSSDFVNKVDVLLNTYHKDSKELTPLKWSRGKASLAKKISSFKVLQKDGYDDYLYNPLQELINNQDNAIFSYEDKKMLMEDTLKMLADNKVFGEYVSDSHIDNWIHNYFNSSIQRSSLIPGSKEWLNDFNIINEKILDIYYQCYKLNLLKYVLNKPEKYQTDSNINEEMVISQRKVCIKKLEELINWIEEPEHKGVLHVMKGSSASIKNLDKPKMLLDQWKKSGCTGNACLEHEFCNMIRCIESAFDEYYNCAYKKYVFGETEEDTYEVNRNDDMWKSVLQDMNIQIIE